MSNAVSCSLWLILAASLTFLMVFTVTVGAASKKQDRNNNVLSVSADEGRHLQNFSIIGKAVFAECFCHQQDHNIFTCSTWKLRQQNASKNSQVEVIDKITTGQVGLQSRDTNGTCIKYLENIIDGVYASYPLNHSRPPSVELLSGDWKFCEDMRMNDDTGCNYTIIPAEERNSSQDTPVYFYFVRSFANASQHLVLGNLYQLEVKTCEENVVSIRVSVPNGSIPQSATPTTEFFSFPIAPSRNQRAIELQPHDNRETQYNINYAGALLSWSNLLCIVASLLATLLALL